MIRFSRREDYAVIFIHELARNYKKRLVPLSEIAKEYQISILFLRNLVAELRNAGIVKAIEGKKGGYFLQKDPSELRMGQVLSVFGQKPMLECCPSGNPKHKSACPKESFCKTGSLWRKLHKEFLDKIYSLSVMEFIQYNTSSKMP